MRASAIDRTLDPALTARFAADLARLWPEGEGGARMGLAVSGGPDSLALLLLAAAALPGRVEAATVDHGLRSESADEAAMVARVCAEQGVQHETLAVTVPPGNLQDRARAARYAALGDWCARRDLVALATGHQRDDQAETLLMRLNRGSGLAGLAGVRARGNAPGSDLLLLRPLLGWPRTELAKVVSAAGLTPVLDPSNENERFDRVRMRRALAATDWLDPDALARSAALLAEAEGFVAESVAELARQCIRPLETGFALRPPTSDFAATELCVALLGKLGGSASRNDAAGLVARLRRGENASLGGVLARIVGGEWLFGPEPPRRL